MTENQHKIHGEVGVPFSMEFQLKEILGNPYTDIDVKVHVSGPDGGSTELPAYWVRNSTWGARYTPPNIGTYRYRVEVAGTGKVAPSSGKFQVDEYTGTNPLYIHGAIRVSEDRRYLCHRDGTPFFWLGDTWWYGATSRCRWPDDFELLVQDRVSKGFTVVQIVIGIPPEVGPNDPYVANEGGYPFVDKRWDLINPDYFEFVDKRIHSLVHNGLVPCILGGWGHHIDWMGTEAMTRFWKYLVARYSAYPVVWCLSGESDIYPDGLPISTNRHNTILSVVKREAIKRLPKNIEFALRGLMRVVGGFRSGQSEKFSARRNAWEYVGTVVSEVDPLGHIITTHPVSGVFSHESLNNAHWVDITGIQSGHSEIAAYPMVKSILDAGHFKPRRPIINMEPWYEGILGKFWSPDQRYAFWMCFLAGAAGHTYGAHGVWQMSTEEEKAGFQMRWGSADWRQGYQYSGSVQLGIAKRFLSQFNWWELEPRVDWVIPHWQRGKEQMPLLAAAERDLFIAYFPPTKERFTSTISHLLPGRHYRVLWFDPRTAEEVKVDEEISSVDGRWTVPRRPSLDDWVFVLQRRL